MSSIPHTKRKMDVNRGKVEGVVHNLTGLQVYQRMELIVLKISDKQEQPFLLILELLRSLS